MKYNIEEVDHTRVIFEFDQMPQIELLKEAIHYISEKAQNDLAFGATKVNKYLYYADLISFARFQRPITGSPYQHLPNGPAPVKLLAARQALVDEGCIRIEERPFFTKKQHRIVPTKPYEQRMLTITDHLILDEVMDFLGSTNASEISIYSHGMAWMTTTDGELIPYNSVFLSDDPVDYDDIHQFKASRSSSCQFEDLLEAA